MHILVFFIVLSLLVVIHEFGHYIMAKRAGMEVEEFGLGIPPRVWGKKIGETLWSINLLPLGGFVKVKGLDTNDADGKPDAKSYQSKTWMQKFLFIIAGPVMNFLLTIFILTIGYTIGMQPLWGTTLYNNNVTEEGIYVAEVLEDGESYGLLSAEDLVLSINGEKILQSEKFIGILQSSKGNDVVFEVERNENIETVTVPVNEEGKIGIAFHVSIEVEEVKLPVLKALGQSVVQTYEISVLTVKSIVDMVSNHSLDGVAGPVGIVKLTGDALSYGFIALMQFTAILSLSLGILNLFPFPALDGGRAFILIIEGILQKKLPPKVEMGIHAAGFALLMILIVIVTISDIRKMF